MKTRVGIAAASAMVIAGLALLPCSISADSSAAQSAAVISLPKPQTAGGMSLAEALAKRRTVRAFADRPLTAEQISQLCWAAQGITEPDKGLRTAPSALAVYPITLYVVDATGLYEYQPKPHTLARLAEGNMLEKLRAAGKQPPLASAPMCMILAMDVAKLTPKARDRAERYSLMESGHIAQNVLLQATALGLAGTPVGGVEEAKIGEAMKLPPQLRTVYLLPIGYPKTR